ncbi:uncharacterized protein TNCV_2837351 [Trichonephila clavipes]|nr:uncharacterized protein TNCV_2837351 [Trichonephila clavipes]
MRYIGQGLSSLETFCSLMCLPNPVSQKAYDRINAKIADISEALANTSMKKVAAEEKVIDGTVNSVVVSGDETWKTHGHTSLIGVCALIELTGGKFSTWKSCPLIARDVTPIKAKVWTKI